MAQKKQDNYLEHLRHSAAHLLAAAVLELWPNTKNTIGPAIENGFYYDFDFGDVKISEDDLPQIEVKMQQILKTWKGFEGVTITPAKAKQFFKDNPYKAELVAEIASKGETLRTYKSGKFIDLCRGGHSNNPKEELKHFKLLSVAGAYWRGSEKNKMLTRIYGTLFPNKEELDQNLEALETAKARDHRKIGQELGLFTINSEEVGPGLVIWLPKGTVIKDELEKFGKETEKKEGYLRISTPHIAREKLFTTSGHLPYYAADMFPPMKSEEGDYYLKPMNCPHMYMAYKAQLHSHRELPIRFAEFGTVYRYEDSGTLMGLLRVRGMTQNDAHIFCTEDQAVEELVKVMKMHAYYYDIFDLHDYYIELALPDFVNKPDKYFKDLPAWKKATSILRKAAKAAGVEVTEKIGEAAFYGPKFDFNFKSVTGREFGASTNQLDFGAGKRFNLTYTDKDGQGKIVPYVIHRAPLGSDERFIGFLIEQYGGAFPVWLSPVQVVVLPITDRNLKYAQNVGKKLLQEDIRVEVDERAETLQAKIRDASLSKVPYMLIVGDREEEKKAVAVRLRTGENLGAVSQDEFLARIKASVEAKTGL